MFNDLYNALTLSYNIYQYVQKNRDNIDLKYVQELINNSSLNDEDKKPLVEFVNDYLLDKDVDGFLNNVEVLVDLTLEHAE